KSGDNSQVADLKVDSQYTLNKSSLPSKQKERYLDVLKFHRAFVDKYPHRRYGRDAEKLYADSQKELERIIKQEEEIQKLREQQENAPNAPARISTSVAQPK